MATCLLFVRCYLQTFCSCSWWCHGMDTLSALLTLCEGNPLMMFLLMPPWTNYRTCSRVVGLRGHDAYMTPMYDATSDDKTGIMTSLGCACLSLFGNVFIKSMFLKHGPVFAPRGILHGWYAIIYPCPRYLFLAHASADRIPNQSTVVTNAVLLATDQLECWYLGAPAFDTGVHSVTQTEDR